MVTWLFVYGTISPDAGNDHEWLCIAPHVVATEPATVEGATLRQTPAFTPVLDLHGNGMVDGFVIGVDDAGMTLVSQTWEADPRWTHLEPVTANLCGCDWPVQVTTYAANDARDWPIIGGCWLPPEV